MSVFILILLLIVGNGLKFSPIGRFNEDYLSKTQTRSVNGIFVILIVLSHYTAYSDFSWGVFDAPYNILKEHLNQMVVVTFWFYSGFGMMESFRKNEEYVQKIPRKFVELLVKFDIVVMMFFLLNIALGIIYPLRSILLSLVAWENLGNSNWYIFAVLVEYILVFFSLKVSSRISYKHRRILGITLLMFATIVFVYILMKVGRPGYTYNTIIILPIGALYSECRDYIEKIVMRNDLFYFFAVMAFVGIYVVTYFHRWDYGIEVYTIWAISFISLVILTTMKVSIYNPVLDWFGAHVFSVYILQRLPMLILYETGCISTHKYASLIIVFVITIVLAIIFDTVTDSIFKRSRSKASNR